MARRVFAILGSAIFLVIAPGFVAGVVPYWISGWRTEPPFLGLGPVRIAGAVLAGIGAIVLLDSFVRFAIQGVGTPAPVFPTRHLVATGLYRYVRNPMYVAVVSLILGQGLLFANLRLIEYGVAVWVLAHLFVVGYEEPTLRRTFGAEYDEFTCHVPRWIPRVSPWRGGPR